MIPRKFWEWYGNAGHLIVSEDCKFHLATKIGNVLVSTIGEYIPHYMTKPVWIGCDRLYETMVFPTMKERCECGCGMFRVDVSDGELDFDGYNDADSANKGHLEMCYKWAHKEDTI